MKASEGISPYLKPLVLFVITFAGWIYLSRYHPTIITTAFPQIPDGIQELKSPIIGYILFGVFYISSFILGRFFDHVSVKKTSASSDRILLALNQTYHLGWSRVPTGTKLQEHKKRIVLSLEVGVPKGKKLSCIKYLMTPPIWAGVSWYLFDRPGSVYDLYAQFMASNDRTLLDNVLLYTILAFLMVIAVAPALASLALARYLGQELGTIRLVNFVRKCTKEARIHHGRGRGGDQKWLQWLCLEFVIEGQRLQKDLDSDLVKQM
jgi:hypothetical protein